MQIILPPQVKFIISSLENAGFKAYAVGGCIRDALMGKEPFDWDICTSAPAEKTIEIFKNETVIETGLKHGTVTLVLNKIPYEITTFRHDGVYADNRHPDRVTFVENVEDDLSRRDFTVNAMAFNEKSGIIDLFGGKADLQNKIIRCVGNPEKRFSEDALRIMRGLRFASVLGFEIEPDTKKSAVLLKSLLKNIAAERINTEFTKLLVGKKASKILLEFREVFEEILPSFSGSYDDAAGNSFTTDNPLYIKAEFFHRLYQNPEMVHHALRFLKNDNKTISFCEKLSANFNFDLPENTSDLRKAFFEKGEDVIIALSDIKNNHKVKNKILEIQQKNLCRSLGSLAIKGSDVKALGYFDKDIGKALTKALYKVMRDEIPNEKTALLEYLKTTETR